MVTFHITVKDSDHGFELDDPNGTPVIQSDIFSPGQIIDKTWTVTVNGTYVYYCTNSGCGGHVGMAGQFIVGMETDPGGPHYKH